MKTININDPFFKEVITPPWLLEPIVFPEKLKELQLYERKGKAHTPYLDYLYALTMEDRYDDMLFFFSDFNSPNKEEQKKFVYEFIKKYRYLIYVKYKNKFNRAERKALDYFVTIYGFLRQYDEMMYGLYKTDNEIEEMFNDPVTLKNFFGCSIIKYPNIVIDMYKGLRDCSKLYTDNDWRPDEE